MPFGALQPAVPTWFRRSRSTAARRQLRRPCAVAHGAQHRRVCELSFRIHAAKHESTAAHVSATDKLSRKKELIAKDREQYIHVLRTSLAMLPSNIGSPREPSAHASALASRSRGARNASDE